MSATKVSDATMSRDFDYRWQQVFAPGAGHPPRTRNPGSSNTGSACVSIAPTRPCAPGSAPGQGSRLLEPHADTVSRERNSSSKITAVFSV